MKKILIALGLLASSCYAANPIISYVQISTGVTQSGGPNTQTATVTNSLSLPFVNGVQCLHSVNGTITGTGLDCGSGGGGGVGGGGTINASPQFSVPFYSVAGSSTALTGSSLFSFYGSSLVVPSVVSTATYAYSGFSIGNGDPAFGNLALFERVNSGSTLFASDSQSLIGAHDMFIEPGSGLISVNIQNGVPAGTVGGIKFSVSRSTSNSEYISNSVGFKAPSSAPANVLWTLPQTDGTNGQVLTTNGSTQLSWSTIVSSGGSGGSGSSIYPATATPTFPFGANATSITTPQVTTAGTFIQTFGGGSGSTSLVFKSASTGFDAYDQITDAAPLQLRATVGSAQSRFGSGAQFQGTATNGWQIENLSNASNPTGLSIINDNGDTTARFINFRSVEGSDTQGGNIWYTPSLGLFQSDRSWLYSFGVTLSTVNATAFNASQTSFTVTGVGGFGIVSSSAGQFGFNEGPSSTFNTLGSNLDAMYANSSSHTLVMNNNASGEYVVAGTSTTNVTGNIAVWCGLGKLCDSGAVSNKSSVVASPQYQVPYYSSIGSSQVVVGASNFTNTGSTATFSSVYTITETNVSSSVLSGAYFDVSASSTNIGFVTFSSTASFSGSNGPSVITVSTSSVGPYAIDISTTNHLNFQDQNSSPTVTSCGSGPSSFGSDNALTVTPGSGATGCVVTFGKPFVKTPICNVTPQTLSLINALSYTVTNKTITLSQTSLTENIDIRCTGRD